MDFIRSILGNSDTGEPAVEEPSEIEVKKEVERRNAYRAQHKLEEERDDGQVECSCGWILPSKHLWNLHMESYPNIGPIDPSGWPDRQFDTIPFLDRVQRGVVARGTIPHAIFTTIKLVDGFNDEQVRDGVSKVTELTTKIGETVGNESHVVSVVSISAHLWEMWDCVPPPTALKTFKEKRSVSSEEILFPDGSTGGDLFLLVKSDRVDLCYELVKHVLEGIGRENIKSDFQVLAFRYMDGRDLTGFIDGTRNPDHLLRAQVDETIIFADDEEKDSPHVGGSYMWAGRFVHQLEKFFPLNEADKSDIIGRNYSVVAPHVGYDTRAENPQLDPVPPKSHIARAHGAMYRQAYPYRLGSEEGLYFTAFSRHLEEIDTALDRICGKFDEDGSADNLLSITKAVSSNYYYVPSLQELSELTQEKYALKRDQEGSIAGREEKSDGKDNGNVEIHVEYCTNCGYQTIYYEKVRCLKAVWPETTIVGNPKLPRQSAFEIHVKDTEFGDVLLWSKLSQPDGKNNYPEVFPTNEHLIEEYNKYLVQKCLKQVENVDDKSGKDVVTIYDDLGTRVGVW